MLQITNRLIHAEDGKRESRTSVVQLSMTGPNHDLETTLESQVIRLFFFGQSTALPVENRYIKFAVAGANLLICLLTKKVDGAISWLLSQYAGCDDPVAY